MENASWEVIPLDQVPAGKQIIDGKWVYTIKGDGRYKARWVIRGFSQRPGVDYDETYAAVSRQNLVEKTASIGSSQRLESPSSRCCHCIPQWTH